MLSPLLPPASVLTMKLNTPTVSQVTMPCSELIFTEHVLTPADVITLFLCLLLQSTEVFLGKSIDRAVLTLPGWFASVQLNVLHKAVEVAGIYVLQLLEDASVAALCVAANMSTMVWSVVVVGLDYMQLMVDLSMSLLAISLLAVHQGLFYYLTLLVYYPNVGGDTIDDQLLKFFTKDFIKTTSVLLKVVPVSETLDLQAEVHLQLVLLYTKWTIMASAGGVGGSTATCFIESLKDGLDYTEMIN